MEQALKQGLGAELFFLDLAIRTGQYRVVGEFNGEDINHKRREMNGNKKDG